MNKTNDYTEISGFTARLMIGDRRAHVKALGRATVFRGEWVVIGTVAEAVIAVRWDGRFEYGIKGVEL